MKTTSTLLHLLPLLLTITNSIYIPLSGRIPRCMIVYSVGESETVKLELNFPAMPDQNQAQFYEVSWKNTETNQIMAETVKSGKFRKQLALSQNVIYDLCIRAETYRDTGVIHVQYSANNIFAIDQASIKVPQNLLKSQDVTNSFMSADKIEKNLDAFIQIQGSKSTSHAEIFRKTNLISERLLQISIAELVVIVLAGVYQFWMLWRYLKGRNYV